jgi:hypothetical protein
MSPNNSVNLTVCAPPLRSLSHTADYAERYVSKIYGIIGI